MEASEDQALSALAEELYDNRSDLVRYFSGLPGAGSVIELQRMLLKEHLRTHRTRPERDVLKHHRGKLRAVGDALAWSLLPAHTIRTLSKHPHRAAAPPVNADDAAFVMQVVEHLASAGFLPIISDLTNVLLVGDVVAIGRRGEIEVVECKNARIPVKPPASGRLARQRHRGERLSAYLRESKMPYGDELQQYAAKMGISTDARPASPSLVATDIALPEPHPEWLAMACSQYEESPHGAARVDIGPGDYLVIADRQALEDFGDDDVLAVISSMDRAAICFHWEQIDGPLPHIRSVLSYPLDWEVRAGLLETELVMMRLVDLAIFEEPDDDGVFLALQDDFSLLWTQGENSIRFSRRFVDEVLGGPVSAADMRDCLLNCLRDDKKKFSTQLADVERLKLARQDERGSGSEARYTTAYPNPGGGIALVRSAADAGLDGLPGVTHADFYPTSQRLVVHNGDGEFLDIDTARNPSKASNNLEEGHSRNPGDGKLE